MLEPILSLIKPYPFGQPKRMKGQVLVLALLLIGAGALALMLMFNLGQMAISRSRLTQTADAAAYSAALSQARALNFLAYINRAQIAHQVAMAHLVSLAAWARWGQTESKQLMKSNPPLGLIAMMFGVRQGQAYGSSISAQTLASQSNEQLLQAFTEHDRIVHEVLAQTSQAILDTLPQVRAQALYRVVQANYPNLSVLPLSSTQPFNQTSSTTFSISSTYPSLRLFLLNDNLHGYLTSNSGNRSSGLRSLIERATARYGWLNARNYTARNSWPVSERCPLRRHELRRRGETQLNSAGKWQAHDTQSFHALRSNTWIGCYYREYAMGWAAVGSQNHSLSSNLKQTESVPKNFSQQDFWRWVKQHTDWNIFSGQANSLAHSYAFSEEMKWPQNGLPNYIDVSIERHHQPLRFALALWQPASTLLTTNAASQVRHPKGKMAYLGLNVQQGITVTSAAETFFSRPDAVRGQEELANTFHPYWQARLVAVTDAEKEQARKHVHGF